MEGAVSEFQWLPLVFALPEYYQRLCSCQKRAKMPLLMPAVLRRPKWSFSCTGLWNRQLILGAGDDGAGKFGSCFRWRLQDARLSQPFERQEWNSEQLWRRFFSDPSQWWDHRFDKTNARFPDFKHKKTQDALWIDARSTPRWVLKACAGSMALEVGKHIHCQVIKSSYGSDVFVGSCLLDMYSKCGSIEDAYNVFENMPQRDVISWSAMIVAYAKSGQGSRALEIYTQMQQELIKPNSFTFVGALTACTSLGALEEGRFLHSQVIENGQESDPHVGSCLVDMYAKSESVEDACKVFNDMPTRDVVSWSAMIVGYVKCGQGGKALELFHEMQREGLEPNNVTFLGLIEACTNLLSLEEGRHVHAQVIQSGWETDTSIENCLLDMYAKCESIEDARELFNNMSKRKLFSWNTMIMGYANCQLGGKAIDLFFQMQCERVEPDNITFLGVLKACSSTQALEHGKFIHEQIGKSKWKSDNFVGNSLIDMYSKCGSMEDAHRVFDGILANDIVCWSAMILGYVKSGQAEEALDLFREMQCKAVEPDPITFVAALNACASVGALEEGRLVHAQIFQSGYDSDAFLGSCLVDMYAKCGSMEEACEVFNNMQLRKVGAWSAMILGYVEYGQEENAIVMFKRMLQEDVVPDSVTFIGVLMACSSIVALNDGKLIHAQVIESGFESDVFVASCLIDMYAKCGSIEDACRVFSNIPFRDVVCWNAVLSGYAMHGLGKKAIQLLEWMLQEGTDMDTASFASLLSACSHAGLADEGVYYFETMSPVYGLSAEVEHHSSMVDLLGRAGHLHEAHDMIKNMPCLPDVSIWQALLGACKIHGNVQMGESAAKELFSLDPEHSSGYVLLSNIYAAAGKWSSKSKVQNLWTKRHASKQPRYTWVEMI
ncbi:hypothetical protein O6H91_13G086000 [Diphasiastrum complanatum]|uniref:Uncharacterized protein n=1 Tax=Diphasiastrum complanatum TaxID=34168 RepID=A0ACC2BWV8_DIPCM|nr:hypothetical protein O6H91_13G086000 [Diphasiastrum complanatum]